MTADSKKWMVICKVLEIILSSIVARKVVVSIAKAAISAAFWSTCDRLARSCLPLMADTRSEARGDMMSMHRTRKWVMNQRIKVNQSVARVN